MTAELVTVNRATGEVIDPAVDRGERAFLLDQALDAELEHMESRAMRVGRLLFQIREQALYHELGHETFWSYVASKPLPKRSQVYKLLEVHRVFRSRSIQLLDGPRSSSKQDTTAPNDAEYSGRLLRAGTEKLSIIAPPYEAAETAAERDEWLSKAEALSQSDLIAEVKAWRHGSLPVPVLPPGRYAVICADPPWAYSNSGFDQSAAAHYDTLDVDEIAAYTDADGRSIADLAAPSSVLFLWATSPLLPEAVRVMEAWGFTYKASMVWLKESGTGIGWFLFTEHEHVLIGVRDETPHPKERYPSVFHAPPAAHSAKPERFYEFVEAMYDGPYVELFARQARTGWEVFGNEV